MALVSNRKAGFNYDFLDKYSGGIELSGFEVKSIKAGQGSLDGSYISIRGGEAFLIGFDLPPYQIKNTPKEYDRKRVRKILLTKAEIKKLSEEEMKKGLSLIPVSIYTKSNKLKLEFVLARGKKKYDKRETIKKRDTEREMRRLVK